MESDQNGIHIAEAQQPKAAPADSDCPVPKDSNQSDMRGKRKVTQLVAVFVVVVLSVLCQLPKLKRLPQKEKDVEWVKFFC